jgi:hypothetical protein
MAAVTSGEIARAAHAGADAEREHRSEDRLAAESRQPRAAARHRVRDLVRRLLGHDR